jgi:MFS family permease
MDAAYCIALWQSGIEHELIKTASGKEVFMTVDAVDTETVRTPLESSEKLTWQVRRVLVVLAVVATLNFVDRQIINILAEKIKAELHLSDTALGFVTGFAFAIFYSVLSIPAARIADRVHRPRFLGGALAVWSVFTMLCGLAGNFYHLVFARVGVGIGEAAGAPTTQSLIADYVPASRRAFAMSVMLAGAPMGAMLGMGIGGVAADLWGWRHALFIVGLPGLLVSLILFLFVREPRAAASVAADQQHEPFLVLLKRIWAKLSLRWMLIAAGLNNVIAMGKYAFAPSFFMRVWKDDLTPYVTFFNKLFGLSLGPTAVVGVIFGIGTAIAGVAGVIVGGRLADFFGRKDIRAMLLLPAIAKFSIIPFGLTAMFAPTLEISFIFMLLATLAQGFGTPAFYAAQLGLVGQKDRSTISAVFLVVSTLVGLGWDP